MVVKYHYKRFLYEKGFEDITVNCEVVEECKMTYKIKLLADNVRGHKYGDIIRVRKDKVEFPHEPVDCTNEWWNNN